MMISECPRIAEFKKVSFEQYRKDCEKQGRNIGTNEMQMEWESIKLPTRATSGSAGYDFYAPFGFTLDSNSIQIVTGIRCMIDPGWLLMCCPKSGLGFRYRMSLDNTIGIIDSDYYNSDNEGHIQAKFTVAQPVEISAGQKFMQGIFLPYGLTANDGADGKRNGGFGSTGL